MTIKNYLNNKTKEEYLYHASNVEFSEFNRCGDRLTSMGLAHYLTDSLDKAKQYGKFIMTWKVNTSGFLDWKNLNTNDRELIEDALSKSIPEDRLAGFGDNQYTVVKTDGNGLKIFNDMKEKTKDYYHEYARASILSDDDIPNDIYDTLKDDEVVIGYKEFTDLKRAGNEQLMNLMQQFRPELAKDLGYSGARFGDEIACYDKNLTKKIEGQTLIIKSSKKISPN
jgi:hypothetical protein